jgi:arabinogalactan oligomer/maltooligosaccharide transport system substrate-binding protein
MKKQLRLAAIVAGVAIIAAACSTPAASTAPSTAPSTGASTAPASTGPESQAPAALTGSVTLWHSYGSGGGETGALNTVLDTVRAANTGLTIDVVE